MTSLTTRTLARSWVALTGLLLLLEVIFLSEAMLANLSGLQKVFGVFLGLAILSFAGLLYSMKVVFYD
jgi:hypothetical protein